MTEYRFPAEIDSLLKALVDTDRLRIIASLYQKDKSVEVLAAELNIKQAKLLKHVALLENTNLVSKMASFWLLGRSCCSWFSCAVCNFFVFCSKEVKRIM